MMTAQTVATPQQITPQQTDSAPTPQQILATAQTAAPLVEAIAATQGPAGQTAAALIPVALTLMQGAIQLQQAGAMTEAQLVTLFTQVSAGIQSAHAQWIAMNNAAPAVPAA